MVIQVFTDGDNAPKKGEKRLIKTHQFNRLKGQILQQQSNLVRWY